MGADSEVSFFLRDLEKKLFFIAASLAAEPAICYLCGFKPHYAFIIGFFIGFASFATLCESFILMGKMQKLIFIMFFITNLKLIVIGLCIWGLHIIGFSALETVFGVIASQIAMTLLFVFNKFLKTKSSKTE